LFLTKWKSRSRGISYGRQALRRLRRTSAQETWWQTYK
jgi:hypothetical protein